MTPSPDIAVLLVGRNSRQHLEGCLNSLQCVDWRSYRHEVIYVDNASADDSVQLVRETCPEARIIVNPANGGFCRACNQAAEASHARYLYLLNNDTLLRPESVAPLAELLDRLPQAAAAGNRLLNPDGSDQWSGRRFPSWRNALLGRRTSLGRRFAAGKTVRTYLYADQMAGAEPFEVDWIPGSCTLVRREAYEQVGGLPEGMHYWSDAVFCNRLHRAGWSVHVVPSSPLIHFEGEGTGQKTSDVRRWLIADFHRGAYQFYCERNRLGLWNPARWLAKAGLSLRASLLILGDRMRHSKSTAPARLGG